ncbi:hypothetical protein BABINDRAFT_163300 [Babjeviella inositovora NRRL Y-12698]|uniref:Major facilitator superfamily (MFS) profile domain-containing protein n=1 Tax=Babjeviella inositovora NRRL Y-12698 TaxID=984486 RepID=A0A1E3QKF7_9ASCO|nr:uncharacterized protein BABINDRAFT_163300 [Babjeviella inositovora NRRL Y-12698]ODQ77562.1 hypothetical protein BABINDRAFT_163300 [Babjeviella inositovora NRRL Y-12698]
MTPLESTTLTPRAPSPIDPRDLPPSMQEELRHASQTHRHHTQMALTPRLLCTVAAVCLGSVQFGYHMAELNAPGAILSCQEHVLPPGTPSYYDLFWSRHGLEQCVIMDTETIGLVTSAFPLGGLLGSIYAGQLADKLGRRRAALLNAVVYALGSFLLATANSVAQIAVGRALSGVAAGCAVVVTALFIAEIAPAELRGLLGSMNQVSINLGILLTQLLAIQLANDHDWRYLLLTGSLLGIANFVALCFIDESPVWLVAHGHKDTAQTALSTLRDASLEDVVPELDALALEYHASTLSARASTLEYVLSPTYRPSFRMTTVIMAGQQFCGINSIIFYGVSVMTQIFPLYAILINCFISLANAIITFISGTLLDRLGRRPLLLLSVSAMGLALLFMAVGIVQQIPSLVIFATFSYVSSFAIGLGPIPFLIISEVTQPEVRSIAQSWGTSTNWVATFLVGFLFPIFNRWLGGYVYLVFAGVCALFGAFLYLELPETKGKAGYDEVWSSEPQLRID